MLILQLKLQIRVSRSLPIFANASTTDDGFFIILSLSSLPQKSKTDHLIVRVSDMDARRWLLILRIAEKLHSAEAEAMYGHCQSQFEQNQCIVDSWLYISSVESGFCNMFLATIICECSIQFFCSHSIVTDISQPDYSAIQFIRKGTETVWTESTECVQYGITFCKAVLRDHFSCHRSLSIISKYLNLNCAHISRLLDIII